MRCHSLKDTYVHVVWEADDENCRYFFISMAMMMDGRVGWLDCHWCLIHLRGVLGFVEIFPDVDPLVKLSREESLHVALNSLILIGLGKGKSSRAMGTWFEGEVGVTSGRGATV
jgi:hypothetical protein